MIKSLTQIGTFCRRVILCDLFNLTRVFLYVSHESLFNLVNKKAKAITSLKVHFILATRSGRQTGNAVMNTELVSTTL